MRPYTLGKKLLLAQSRCVPLRLAAKEDVSPFAPRATEDVYVAILLNLQLTVVKERRPPFRGERGDSLPNPSPPRKGVFFVFFPLAVRKDLPMPGSQFSYA